jgi:ceramide glucosyltransferase
MWSSALVAIPLVATACGILYSLLALWSSATFRWRAVKKSNDGFTPKISLLKPLCGVDPYAYESLRSHCLQDYPAFEIIFGISDPNDAVVPIVHRLMAEFPQISMKLVVCPLSLGTNRKISSLIQMVPAAKHDFLLINDSDVSVPSDYLRRVISPLADAATGMVTCFYRAIPGESTLAHLESISIASDFVPGVLCARRLESGLHFALGSTLAFARQTLEDIGGLRPLSDYLADDYEIGNRTAQAGKRIEVADCIVDHWIPAYSWSGFIQHQLRWARTIRSSRPGGYAGLVLTFVLPWSLLTLFAARGAEWAWVLFASVLIVRYAVTLVTQVAVLRERPRFRQLWLLPIRDFIAPFIWITCYMGRRVLWRGIKFEVVNGKLRPV